MTCDGLASRPGGVEILLAASCYGNQDRLWPDEPVLAPKASLFTSIPVIIVHSLLFEAYKLIYFVLFFFSGPAQLASTSLRYMRVVHVLLLIVEY